MKKKTKKAVETANTTVQDAQSAVYGDQEREEATKKRAKADVNAANVREMQTALSCQANIDEVKVESHHNMQHQAKLSATVLSKYKIIAQKKLKKHAAASEAIVRDASQKISQLKHEVSFQKEERDCERLAGDEAVSQESVMGNETLLLDRKSQSKQLTKLKQRQSSVQSTDSRIISELLEQVDKLKIDSKESKDAASKAKR